MSYEPLDERWRSFGWSVRIIDGHNLETIINNVKQTPFEKGKPSVIIADTIKSKGLSFAEGKVSYHYWKANPEEMEQAERDLDNIEKQLKEKMEEDRTMINELKDPRKTFGEAVIEAAGRIKILWSFQPTAVQDQDWEIS